MTLRVSSNGSKDLANLHILAQSHEESDSVDGVAGLFLLRVEDALDQLDLVFRNIDHILGT